MEQKEKMLKKLEIKTSSDSSNGTLSGKDDTTEHVVSYNLCDHRTKTDNGMKQHIRKKLRFPRLMGIIRFLKITKSKNL